MTYQYAKAIRKKLMELAGLAYKRELNTALETLDKHFAQWHRLEIDCFELNDRIHSFHQKTSRELWKTYFSMEDDFLVCRAVKLGFLSGYEIANFTGCIVFLFMFLSLDRACVFC